MGSSSARRWIGVCIDCIDADELARFYGLLLGWDVSARDGHDWVQLRDPGGGVGINIQSEKGYEPPIWPETPGRQQKMLHLEVEVDDLDASVQQVVKAGGAVAAHQPQDRDPSRIRIMLDPAGHPFCIFLAGE